ncbi:MAG: hypothetical protein AB1665_00040 [Candidatus Thermoplasmatota archaeon]
MPFGKEGDHKPMIAFLAVVIVTGIVLAGVIFYFIPRWDYIREPEVYFNVQLTEPVNTSIGYRVGETKSLDSRSDRVYAVHGNTIEAFKPDGTFMWRASFNDASDFPTAFITTAPVCKNIGDKVVRDRAEFRVIFGTVEGYVYCLMDNEDADSPGAPRGINLARSGPLDGRISNDPVVYNPDGIANDRLFITTENGTLYAFSFSNDSAQLTREWDLHLSNASLNAPAVAEVYEIVTVSDVNGSVYGVSISDHSLIWRYETMETVSSDIAITPWNPRVAYIATDAARLHVINVVNGTPLNSEWAGGMLIMKTPSDVDEGPLNTPAINQDGTEIYITSRSGFMYVVISQTQEVKVRYDATEKGTMQVTFEVPALFDVRYRKGVYAVARDMSGTANDLSDDFSWLYRFTDESIRTERYAFKFQIPGRVQGPLQMWHDTAVAEHLYPTIWLGTTTTEGAAQRGNIYAISSGSPGEVKRIPGRGIPYIEPIVVLGIIILAAVWSRLSTQKRDVSSVFTQSTGAQQRAPQLLDHQGRQETQRDP